ncbi:hypothetical protein RZO50_11105 [Microbacterium sp. SSW1-59]|uniref:hypothetical protein n=1 Tax=Microbacterium xanthum TaxID=3079794 RepID=UPI002AD494EC|nr:hypothetical protein [Microbacterium sp. SSW1-59]MDZ8202064.1 hypothetical protein [Microbacterium sp. SSW1-59]
MTTGPRDEIGGVMRFCRSRRGGRRCTRPVDHAGLHRHRTVMWADTGADPLRCTGSGTTGAPAATLPDGWPHGHALCPTCHRFVPLHGGVLAPHDTSDPAETQAGALRRREWFNTFGW